MLPRLSLLLLLLLARPTLSQVSDSEIDAYLESTLEHALSNLDTQVVNWKARYQNLDSGNIVAELLGYQPPTFMASVADLSSHLYSRTNSATHAKTTRDLLVSFNDYREFFPERFQIRAEYADGIPAVNWFRSLPVYVDAYLRTKDSGAFSAEDHDAVEEAVASGVEIIFKHPEWGGHNRALLRAESLMAAAVAFPENQRAADWRRMAEILASDNIGKWEIEDASSYHPIWMHAYISYLDLSETPEAFKSPIFRYYFDYFVSLLTPDGTIPEFGDGWWYTNLNESILILERGAREYASGEMKWAARRMQQKMGYLTEDGNAGPAFETPNVGLARTLIRLRDWSTPYVEPVAPTHGSGDVLDEVIGMKTVFRSGWGPDDAYLLLNYKDEGYSSVYQKDYLKQVLAVEEEKMHHGQSDENSIALFMKEGSVLLADGGYRDEAPSGPLGAYRSDFFHNRLVVRNSRKGRFQSYFDVITNSGAHNDAVRTTKMDFQTFPEFEYSRTRLEDSRTGYEADRTIIQDRTTHYTIVVDAMKALRSDYFTGATLWHTRQILETGPNWYRTRIDSLQGRYPNPGDMELLVILPQENDRAIHEMHRARQTEQTIHQGFSQYMEAGDVRALVSILVPIRPDENAAELAARFQLTKDDEEAVTVTVDSDHHFGIKNDLDRDLLAENIRPRYSWESGRIDYGPFETDADVAFVATSGAAPVWSGTNLVRMIVGGETVFDAPASQFFQVWGKSDVVGVAKWRRWGSER